MKKYEKTVVIRPPELGHIKVRVGGNRLLMNRQSEEVKDKLAEYFDGRKGKAKGPKPIDIQKTEEEIVEMKTHYTNDGKVGFPTEGFKKGMVNVAQSFGLYGKDVKTGVVIEGDIVPVEFKEMEIHRGMGRTSGMGRTPIPTIRPLFRDWVCDLEIRFNASKFQADDIVNILNHAGFYSGLGDWRTEKGGSFGQYKVLK